MSGGINSGRELSSTELFLPSTGKSCSLQYGTARERHTLDQLDDGTLLACGGTDDRTKYKYCHQFVPSPPYGTWTMFARLRYSRYDHTSLVSGGKVLLLGGGITYDSTEVVGGDQSFNLQQSTM